MRSAVLVALLSLVAGCGPTAAAAPAAPAPGIAWTYLGRTPGDGASIFEACVPMPGKGYSRRLISTDPGNRTDRVPSITVDSQGC